MIVFIRGQRKHTGGLSVDAATSIGSPIGKGVLEAVWDGKSAESRIGVDAAAGSTLEVIASYKKRKQH